MDSTSNSKAHEIDFSIFKIESSECNITEKKNEIIANCSYLQRMCVGLRYYGLLCKENKLRESKVAKEVLVEFCDVAYTNLLDDYIHIVQNHNDDLIEIGDEMSKKYECIPCKIEECSKLQRHYRGRGESENNKDDFFEEGKFLFYSDCFDRSHHQIYHLHAMGLKLKRNEIEIKEDEHKKGKKVECFDSMFQRRRDLIIRRKKECGLDLERYNDQNNKYIIKQQQQNGVHSIYKIYNKNGTFLDSMCRIFPIQNKSLWKYLYLNEYDTEGVQEDLEDVVDAKNEEKNHSLSNICCFIQNKLCIQIMIEYIANIKCM